MVPGDLPFPCAISIRNEFLLGEVGWLAKNYVGAGGEFAGMSRGHRQFPCGRED